MDRYYISCNVLQIIYLDGVQSKTIENQNFNTGNVGWEIVINSNGKINVMGGWDVANEENIPVVALVDVADITGKISKLRGGTNVKTKNRLT